MQPHEIANIVVAFVALVVSFVALFITRRVAVVSISAPLVLQELYEIAEHLDSRHLGDDPLRDMDRLKEEIDLVRRKDFVLRKTGFGAEIYSFEKSVTQFSRLQKQLKEKKTPVDDQEQAQFMSSLADADTQLQNLFKRIRTKLDGVYTDPFTKDA